MSPVLQQQQLPVANSTIGGTTAATGTASSTKSTTTTTATTVMTTLPPGKMANSNTSLRQMGQQTAQATTTAAANTTTTTQSPNIGKHSASAAAATVSSTIAAATALSPSADAITAVTNKPCKTVTFVDQHNNKVPPQPHADATVAAAAASKEISSSSAAPALAIGNAVISSQCDSSSGSSTTSSSSGGSDIQSLSLKSENCDAEIKSELDASKISSGQAGANDLQLAAMKHRPILLSTMNAHIICGLCFGYLIDATTIVECLHSFCHSCLIKHLRTEKYCPRCEMMINTAKPNIKPDTTLQAIVYKLVPGLYEKELMRKRAFYKDRPEEAALATPEQRGDDTEHLIFSPSDYMSISLEYADIEDLSPANEEYKELLKPRYLECPAMFTVALMKKLVYGKFEINSSRFTIDIMYKVKTIILLDHYTLMDVAYIYTWKRDAPMRFFFRVKQAPKCSTRAAPKPEAIPSTPYASQTVPQAAMCIVHEATPSLISSSPSTASDLKILEPEEIKQENESEVSSTTESLPPHHAKQQFEIVQPPSPGLGAVDSSPTDKLKITIVNKAAKERNGELKSISSPAVAAKPAKEKKDHSHKLTATPKDERKVENIKLKIDLSKQNSVTIINMSDPQRKEIVKPVRHEKEWKVTKSKKDKEKDKDRDSNSSSSGSPKSSPKSSPHSERKNKTPSPLTVPPLTLKAERISPLAKLNSSVSADEEQKSEFLKSFALAPISEVMLATKTETAPRLLSKEVTLSVVPKSSSKDSAPAPYFAMPAPASFSSSSSKRKSKEPVKAVIKKPKLSPPLATEDFKIKLPSIPNSTSSSKAGSLHSINAISSGQKDKKELMPPPAPLTIMKPPASLLKKAGKLNGSKMMPAPPGSLTPHPMHGSIPLAPPGSRTPIVKRYQPILPKTPRPNHYANIPSDVNKLLKDAGTEIKSIPNEPPKVYGPKTDASLMGPPTMAAPSSKSSSGGSSSSRSHHSSSNASKSSSSNSNAKNNSYLNLALFNATKSKGNEVPPGCRTPMYTPNSPIYSPSSPQYVPNYNIPTVPTYKYTPKPSSNSYLQSVLNQGANNQMSGLFPSPPVKKDAAAAKANGSASTNSSNSSSNQQPKRVYPFARSPSPVEDPPEKQLKVKSLLNSCNINIPSSLSITITREDADGSANGASYPKHKSPVNNYIEILKLPDQTIENVENKRSSPPANCNNSNSLFPNPPTKRVATPPLAGNGGKSVASAANHNNMQGHLANQMSTNSSNGVAAGSPVTAAQIATNGKGSGGNMQKPPQSQMAMTNGTNNNNNNSNNTNTNASKPPTALSSHNKSPVSSVPAAGDKKSTPSPEKRPLSTAQTEQKSPKSPDGPGAKKFRHILPRQIAANPTTPAPAMEVNVPKVAANSGNVIGTYSHPNGVNVKIHSSTKKVQPGKKSPGVATAKTQAQQQQQLQAAVAAPIASMAMANKATSGAATAAGKATNAQPAKTNSNKTLSVNNNNNNNNNKLAVTPVANLSPSLAAPPPSPVMPHHMLPPHLGAAAASLLRAQVQAAVANQQSNMFYPYAANAAAAAQLGQFNPTMYNYQQAYIMDQLTRMRAGTDMLTEYMQKLKSQQQQQSQEAPAAAPAPAAPKLPSPVAATEAATSPKQQKTNSPKSNSSNGGGAAGGGAAAAAAAKRVPSSVTAALMAVKEAALLAKTK